MTEPTPHAPLTTIQRCIAGRLLAGERPQEIALQCGRLVRTIEWHIEWHIGRLYARTETAGRVEFVLWAAEHRACCIDGPDVAGEARSFTGP